MAAEIHVVSPERIAMEMRRLLADSGRAVGVRLMLETGLARELLPEILSHDASQQQRLDDTLSVLERLGEPCGFPLALAALLQPFVTSAATTDVCRRWRLANKETDRVAWLVEKCSSLVDAASMRWSQIQPVLIADGIDDLLRWMEAISPALAETAGHCRKLADKPREQLDPPPLLTGDDLLAHGIPSGPHYKKLLQRIRDAQLDGEVFDKDAALAMAEKWRVESKE
jgi:tRNA nucleotidyltransferase/poly(A) polymerase